MSKTETAKKNITKIISILKEQYPASKCSLLFSNPWELLVATILSAQCTDERVNTVTRTLFKKYPTIKEYAYTSVAELEQDIRSTGFYHNKARTIRESAIILFQQYNGEVPSSLEILTNLPGVGRKTANVVLGTAYDIPGIVVDTHVKRISFRLGLTIEKDPVKIEKDLSKIIPREEWINFGHLLIDLGREICTARKPKCKIECRLKKLCPQRGVQ